MNYECLIRKWWFFTGLVIIMAGCGKAPVCDCFESAGSESSQARQVSSFTQLISNDNINVFITTGSPQQVVVEGGKNLIPNIAANVSNGVLTLHNNNICNWLRSYKKSVINVYLTVPQLTTITNSGYGTVQSQGVLTYDSLVLNTTNSPGDIDLDVNSNYINAHMFGTADLALSGQCNTFEANFFGGTGFIYNNSLTVSGYGFVSSNTTGDCYINCNGTLAVHILGQGNVYYTGSATVNDLPGTGSGKLIKE